MSPQYVQPVGPQARREVSNGQIIGWTLVSLSMLWPRVVILAFWFFGSTLGKAYSSWVIPVIGFVIAPWTTMTYAFMWGLSSDRVSGIEWLFVGIAVLFDLWTWGGLQRLRGS